MSPSRKETPASASAHQERVRRATAKAFANAAAHNADSPPLPGSSPGPPSGWVNDPSGLIYFRNRSHIFTNTPHTAPHSALSTGHAASADRSIVNILRLLWRPVIPMSKTAVSQVARLNITAGCL